MIARALSIRVIFLSLLVGVCAGVLIQLVWATVPLMPAVWLIAAATYVLAVSNREQAIRCQACGKRVKLGYDSCHHCGQVQAPAP